MKPMIRLVLLIGIALFLNSCGLPGALVRTAGNAVQGAGNLLGPALGAF